MAVPGHTMPNMGHTITHQVMKNHSRLYQTQTTGKENQWQPRKESQVLGMRASSIWAKWPSYCEHNQVDTHKRTHAHTHAHTHTHTHTRTYTHTLLQSYPCWSKACRLSDVKVMNGWPCYRRCSFYAGFTSCTVLGKRNS